MQKLAHRAILVSLATASAIAIQAKDTLSEVWVPDLGNGQYQNPILDADYSDPDVIRVGDDFYMTASSFCDIPGLPVLHSKDLVNWTIIGHAFAEMPDYAQSAPDPSHGNAVWAPAMLYPTESSISTTAIPTSVSS